MWQILIGSVSVPVATDIKLFAVILHDYFAGRGQDGILCSFIWEAKFAANIVRQRRQGIIAIQEFQEQGGCVLVYMFERLLSIFRRR